MIATADQPAKTKPNPIETLQSTVSASRMACWSQCRLKFFFRYVRQISKPPTAALHVGSVVHLVLKSWNMARWRKQPFNVELFKGLFDKHWIEQTDKINWQGEEATQKFTAWTL